VIGCSIAFPDPAASADFWPFNGVQAEFNQRVLLLASVEEKIPLQTLGIPHQAALISSWCRSRQQ